MSLGKLFVFRLINPVAIDVDALFVKIAKEAAIYHLDDSILHCEMIGEALMQDYTSGSWMASNSSGAVLY